MVRASKPPTMFVTVDVMIVVLATTTNPFVAWPTVAAVMVITAPTAPAE